MKLNNIKIWKLNALDIAILLVVIIFATIFLTNKIDISNENVVETGNAASTTFNYTISIKGLSETSREMFKVGDEVYDKVTGTYIGKISELGITEAKGLIEEDNGQYKVSNVPEKIDVEMKVETDGTIKNGEYLSNGLIRIMVGNSKAIKTKYVMCSGTISSIER